MAHNNTSASPFQSVRLSDLLTSNYAPYGEVRAEVLSFLHEHESMAHGLAQRIAQARRALTDLDNRRKLAESLVGQAKRILHPIRALPVEILGEIFVQAAACTFDESNRVAGPAFRDGKFTDSFSTQSLAWSVSHVSSRWRHAALCTPKIWTRLSFSFDIHPNSTHAARLLALYLSRSAIHPLTIQLQSTKSHIPAMYHHAMSPLVASAPRWRDVRLSLSLISFAALDSLRPSFPQLRTLRLDKVGLHSPQVPLSLFNAANAPSLQMVGIDNFSVLSFFQLGVQEIIGHTPNNDMMQVKALAGHPSVRAITFEEADEYQYPIPQRPLPSFTHHGVQALTIRGRRGQTTGFILRHASAKFPNIKTLTLEVPITTVSLLPDVLRHSLRNISFTVANLDQPNVMLQLRQILLTTPHVKRLELNFQQASEHVAWSSLEARAGESVPAPSLHTLVLRGQGGMMLAQPFVDFIRSRCPGLKVLEVDQFSNSRSRSPKTLAARFELSALTADGLVVNVTV